MARVTWFVVVVMCACSGTKQEAPAAGSSGASAAAVAAAKLTDACPLLPMDKVAALIPEAKPPASEQYPLRCSVYGKASALEIAFDSGAPPDPKDGEAVTGIAQGGILQRLAPKEPGNVYVTLSLGTDANGANRNLHVEVNGLGKDHKEDALDLARAVVARLK